MTDETTETEATETTEPEAEEATDWEATAATAQDELARTKAMLAHYAPDVDLDDEARFVVPNKAGDGFDYRPSAPPAPSAKPVKARTAGAARSSAKAEPKGLGDMSDDEFDAFLKRPENRLVEAPKL